MRQNSTVTASSKRAAGGVGFGWAISCSLWRGVGWPLFYSQTTQHSSSGLGAQLSPLPQFLLQTGTKKRADDRTRTAFLLITSVRSVVAECCTGLQFPHR